VYCVFGSAHPDSLPNGQFINHKLIDLNESDSNSGSDSKRSASRKRYQHVFELDKNMKEAL
jgi:hypothetical protein